MALITVHSTPLLKEYQSTVISRATLFTCVCWLLSIFLPLLVAYASNGFWSKHQTLREQPNIAFQHNLLMVANSGLDPRFMTWSTFPEYNQLVSSFLRRPNISSIEYDENNDGIAEGLKLTLEMDTTSNETIQYIQVLLIFTYELKEICHVSMETMAVLQYNSGMAISKLHYVGDLVWVQRKMLQFQQSENRYNETIVQSDRFEVADILKHYHSRQYATELQNGHYTPQFGSGTGLEIEAYIRYAEAEVEFAPGFWNVIKWAWVQYASILIIVLYVVENIKKFAFRNQLVPTWNEKKIQHIHQ